MTTKVSDGMTTGLVKTSNLASKAPSSKSSGDEGKVVQLDSSGGVPSAYVAAGGKVAQLVSTSSVAGVSKTFDSGSWADTGYSVAITPTATGSKILVEFTTCLTSSADPGAGLFKIYRDSSDLTPAGADHLGGHYHPAQDGGSLVTIRWVDTAPGTSAYTYKLYLKSYYGAGTIYLGRNHADDQNYVTLATATEITV